MKSHKKSTYIFCLNKHIYIYECYIQNGGFQYNNNNNNHKFKHEVFYIVIIKMFSKKVDFSALMTPMSLKILHDM